MSTYVDSSALVAIYVPERFSQSARAEVGRASRIPVTALHELEVPNAFAQLAGRKDITHAQLIGLLDQWRTDLRHPRFSRASLDLDRAFVHAAELSRKHTVKWLTRSLDLLHVALAHAAQCATFVSADDRQLAVAKATGLRVVDIKRRTRATKPAR